MNKILLTGFEPFGGEMVNPSWQVASALDGEVLGGAQVVAVQLPCVFAAALPALQAALASHQPNWVLSLGLAGSRSVISVERVAVNLVDARIPDNAGAQPVDRPVVAGGPAAYFTGLPAKAIVADLQQAGYRAELSHTAGSYVCNQVFYGLMHALSLGIVAGDVAGDVAGGQSGVGHGVKGGFIHLPPMPEQADSHPQSRPMALDEQVAALRRAVELVVADTPELRIAGGRID